MDQRTNRNVGQRKGVAYLRRCICSAHYRCTYLESVGCNDISFCSVDVIEQSDTSRTVRIILDALYNGGYTVFAPLKVDDAVFTLVTAAHVAGGQVSLGVTAAG